MGNFRLRPPTIAVPARPDRVVVVKYCCVPSPVGHALAGIAAGWLVQPAPVPSGRSAVVGRLCLFAAAGAAADLDLLLGIHSGPSHGVGVALLAGVLVWLALRGLTPRPGGWGQTPGRMARMAAAVAAAYGTHTLLDWLGTDTSAPIGVMALWPYSREYFEKPLHVFMGISRRYWLPEFWTHNALALARELLILVPLVAASILVRRWR